MYSSKLYAVFTPSYGCCSWSTGSYASWSLLIFCYVRWPLRAPSRPITRLAQVFAFCGGVKRNSDGSLPPNKIAVVNDHTYATLFLMYGKAKIVNQPLSVTQCKTLASSHGGKLGANKIYCWKQGIGVGLLYMRFCDGLIFSWAFAFFSATLFYSAPLLLVWIQ